ncbi:unnamed protein product [Malus baccata var. baccata]
MKFGGGFLIPQDDDLRVTDSWVPVTPQKPIPVKPHPVPVNLYGNLRQGGNWQQQLTGISREDVPVGASYNGMAQPVCSNDQLLRNGFDESPGENIQMINHISDSYNAGSFTQLLFDEGSSWNDNLMTQQLLHDNAAYVASANRNPSKSVDIAANTPLIPKLHPQMSNQGIDSGSFLLTNQNCNHGSYPWSNVGIAVNTHPIPKLHPQLRNQGIDSDNFSLTNQNWNNGSYPSSSVDVATKTNQIPKLHPQSSNQGITPGSFLLTDQNCSNGSYPSSNVMSTSLVMDFPSQVDNSCRDSNSVHWLSADQNHCSSSNSNPLSNGNSSSQTCRYGFPSPLLSSCDLNSLPRIKADASPCVARQHQFTTDQNKNLENDQLSAILKFLKDEDSGKEKDNQVKLTMSIEDEAIQKYSDELLQNIVESSSAAISTPYKENKDSDREGDRGIDLNITPQQKAPKRRKHRPKVIREGKPKGTPKPATPNNTESKESQPAKRKYVRKSVQKESPSPLGDGARETIDPNGGKGAKSCKRALDFDSENTMDENQCKAGGQREQMQQGINMNFDSQGKPMVPGTSQGFKARPSKQSVIHSKLKVENQIPGTMNNCTSSMNLMSDNFVFLPERRPSASLLATTKDMHLKKSHVMGRHVENGSSDLSHRRYIDGYTPFQQHTHAKGVGQDAIRMKTSSESLQMKENITQGNSQSVQKILSFSLPREVRGSKREYCRTVEHTHLSTNQPPSSLSCQEIKQLDGHQRMLSQDISLRHKQQKFENGYLSIYNMPCEVTPLEECLGIFERTGPNTVNSNGFASKNHTMLSSSIERNERMDRQNKGIGRFMSDSYTQSVASGNSFLNPQISSTHSCQDFAQVLSFSNHSTIEACNQLASSYPRKSFQPGNKEVSQPRHDNMLNMKQTVGPTQAGIDNVLQEKDALYDYQQPSAKAIGFTVRRYTTLPDDIVHKFNNLNLNGRCSKILEHEQNALVPYKGDGAVVPYERFIKKRKPRPKVELDPETNRIWNLLMGMEGSGGIEGNDMEKEKYWEEERKVFQGRVESFIARMHLVQGDRRFSKWKGSVVDSVIGVFLTQNVSDHLSSSAFMSLAARFPLKSSNHQAQPKVRTNILVKEPAVHMTSPDDATKWHEDRSSQPIYHPISMTLHESEENQKDSETSGTERNLVDAHSQCLEEEFVSSQDSFESSVTQGALGIKSCSGSNSETEDPGTGCQPKVHVSISTCQQMAKGTKFQDFYNQVNGSSVSYDGSKNGHFKYAQLKRKSDRIDHLNGTSFKDPINLDDEKMQVPVALSSNNQFHMNPDSGKPESWKFGNFSEESISSWPTTASRFNIQQEENCKSLRTEELAGSVVNSSMQQNTLWSSQGTPTKGPYPSFREHLTDQQSNSQPRSSTGYKQPSLYSHQFEGNPTFQSENTSVTEPVKHTEPFLPNKSDSMQHVQNVSELSKKNFNVIDSISVANKHIHMENHSVDSNLQEKLNSYGQSNSGTSTKPPKGRKGKAESEKKNAVDWDILRKQAQANGRKTERKREAMDSLDYEALINANVKEISDAIKERGMNNLLAQRMQEFLKRLVREHESIDLEWLRDVPPDKAKDYLLSIRGLGLKSVECIRLLTLHHLAFPVDTNVGRIAVRLGWVPLQPLPESLQLHLLELYPMLETVQKYLWPRLCKLDQLTLYELHYQMITFGKVFCTKSKPNCNACPMRGECRHFASAFASARLALPGPEEKSIVSSSVSREAEINPEIAVTPMSLPLPENNSLQIAGTVIKECEPIIEEPATPEQELTELSESELEDFFCEDPDEIPTIKLNMEEFTATLQNYMQEKMELQEGDMSKALVALNPEATSIPTPKLKNVSRLRTEHQVYELPDSHPLLEGMDRREPDDPSPYLLAIWTPGETANSIQQPESRCSSQDQNRLCNEKTCFSCNSIREENSQIVRGTILIPCRTAMRGSFPLNGTYFQVNEMFADHESSHNPIDVPRGWIWNLPRRTVYFGTSVSTIFKGLSTEGIQYCFWRGYVCVRGFERKTRAPRPLMARLHFPASKMTKTINEGKK